MKEEVAWTNSLEIWAREPDKNLYDQQIYENVFTHISQQGHQNKS